MLAKDERRWWNALGAPPALHLPQLAAPSLPSPVIHAAWSAFSRGFLVSSVYSTPFFCPIHCWWEVLPVPDCGHSRSLRALYRFFFVFGWFS